LVAKKKGLFTTLIIIGIIAIGAVGFLSFSSKEKENSASPQTLNATDISQPENQEKDSVENNETQAEPDLNAKSAPVKTSDTAQTSAEKTLNDFLSALVSNNKTNITNYSSSDFANSDFVKGIIANMLTAPDSAKLINLESKTDNANYKYIVNETYNIDKENNAGSNGSYIYTLKLENNQWKIFSRE
jgi:hypothetical protein